MPMCGPSIQSEPTPHNLSSFGLMKVPRGPSIRVELQKPGMLEQNRFISRSSSKESNVHVKMGLSISDEGFRAVSSVIFSRPRRNHLPKWLVKSLKRVQNEWPRKGER